MWQIGILAFAAVAALATPAWPCSVVALPTPQDLVNRAEVIVRVRADGLAAEPGRQGILASNQTQVRFTVLTVLKGFFPSVTLQFNGHLDQRDDRNDAAVPYHFIRPGGRGGSCFAMGYRSGAEYLLLLAYGGHQSYAQPNDLTPYWTPLGPTNEQLSGSSDPWLRWVMEEINKNRTPR
jgi:hypothetical protein